MLKHAAHIGLMAVLVLAFAGLEGCGGDAMTAKATNPMFAITPGTTQIDTNCTGCNAVNSRGVATQQFNATLKGGNLASVTWTITGGDATAGAGAISANGQYTPPSYLTADKVSVLVTASLKANPSLRASTEVTVTPGFLQPLTPQNLALGAGGSATVTGILAEVGGNASVHFALSDEPAGGSAALGTLGVPSCVRAERAFTICSVAYTAPAVIQGTGVTHIVATAGNGASKLESAVLLNAAGVASNPAGHQSQLATPMLLGSSGGNNADFDAHGNTIVDCCGGTLGALVQDAGGKQYLLSNNHVLARSDHADVGDAVVQPGLIDNNCTPNGYGAGTVPVGTLTRWLPLSSNQTNADAAIAEVASHTVDATGSILELGGRQADGSLAAAAPGVSSTGGRGETASLTMRVAKSGRTTGLTCGGVSAIHVDVSVDYFRDCAETKPYLTKLFTNQVGVSGNQFSDAGDSGALLVDTQTAEPVGLYFAGGADTLGVSHGVASPIGEVLDELGTQGDGSSNFTVVGGADHGVSCLSYGDSSVTAAQARALSDSEIARAESALAQARTMVNAAKGILGVALGKSSDHAGEAAVIVYVNGDAAASVPMTIDGVRTVVIQTDARAVAFGTAPMANVADGSGLASPVLAHGIAIKSQLARGLMQRTPAFFGVGVGPSLDNPAEAALVIYVDRRRVPAALPVTMGGLRTHYVVMDRLHVTRSFAVPFASTRHCMPHMKSGDAERFDPALVGRPQSLGLN